MGGIRPTARPSSGLCILLGLSNIGQSKKAIFFAIIYRCLGTTLGSASRSFPASFIALCVVYSRAIYFAQRNYPNKIWARIGLICAISF